MKYYQTIIMENKEIDGILYYCFNEENYKKISEEREEQLKEIERLQRQKEELQVNGLRQETLFKLEIERLNKELENLEKLNNANYQSFIETNKTLIELEKWIKEILLSKAYSIGYKEAYKDIYMKLQELKGSDKE